MEGQEYLNQISASNRPMKNGGGIGSILSSKFLWIGIIGVVAFVMIAMVGSMLSSGKNSEEDLTHALKLHVDNTMEIINTYQPNVKSSVLRSSSASLNAVLSNTSTWLSSYLSAAYPTSVASEKVTAEATEAKDTITAELFEAKINGILDRIYAHKMAYETSLIMNEESRITESTGDENLKAILDESYDSLERLYDDFDNFSETK